MATDCRHVLLPTATRALRLVAQGGRAFGLDGLAKRIT